MLSLKIFSKQSTIKLIVGLSRGKCVSISTEGAQCVENVTGLERCTYIEKLWFPIIRMFGQLSFVLKCALKILNLIKGRPFNFQLFKLFNYLLF